MSTLVKLGAQCKTIVVDERILFLVKRNLFTISQIKNTLWEADICVKVNIQEKTSAETIGILWTDKVKINLF